jgi:hypothetical protein
MKHEAEMGKPEANIDAPNVWPGARAEGGLENLYIISEGLRTYGLRGIEGEAAMSSAGRGSARERSGELACAVRRP